MNWFQRMVLRMLGLKLNYEVKRKQPSARNTRGRLLYKTLDYSAACAKVKHYQHTPTTVEGGIHLEAYIEISETKALGLTPGYPGMDEAGDADPPPREQLQEIIHRHDFSGPMGYDPLSKTFRSRCPCGLWEPKTDEQTFEPAP